MRFINKMLSMAAILSTLLLCTTAASWADTVIMTTPAPHVVTGEVVTYPTTVETTVVPAPVTEPGVVVVGSDGVPIPTVNGRVFVPAGGDGFISTSDGGYTHYWTDGNGTTFYQSYDNQGRRGHLHHL